jgi:hypothetical protein
MPHTSEIKKKGFKGNSFPLLHQLFSSKMGFRATHNKNIYVVWGEEYPPNTLSLYNHTSVELSSTQ